MRLVFFGDSLLDTRGIYSGKESNIVQLLQNSILPFIITNYAEGGSLTGGAEEYAYKINGEILKAKGLQGQVSDYLAQYMVAPDAIIIWSGTNDSVIGAQLDPFETADGQVTASELVVAQRILLDAVANPFVYINEVVKYIIQNYRFAASRLHARYPTARIIFITPLNLSLVPISDFGSKAEIRAAVMYKQLITAMKEEITPLPNCTIVDIVNIVHTIIDAIHLDTKAQTAVCMQLLLPSYL